MRLIEAAVGSQFDSPNGSSRVIESFSRRCKCISQVLRRGIRCRVVEPAVGLDGFGRSPHSRVIRSAVSHHGRGSNRVGPGSGDTAVAGEPTAVAPSLPSSTSPNNGSSADQPAVACAAGLSEPCETPRSAPMTGLWTPTLVHEYERVACACAQPRHGDGAFATKTLLTYFYKRFFWSIGIPLCVGHTTGLIT